MMSFEERRRWILALLLVGAALIALLLWWLFGQKKPVVEKPALPVASQPLKEIPVVSPKPGAVAPTPVVAQAQVVARDFTERFATYSSDVPYTNFTDVAALSTAKFAASLTKNTATSSADYVGVTARALSVTIESGSEAQKDIVFLVSVQKEQFSKSRLAPTIAYATASVHVLQENGVWKVDGFSWR